MLDRTVYGDTSRVSPEAPVPVVRVTREDTRLGGAANVAANLVGLGVQTTLIGTVGQDVAGSQLREQIEHAGIRGELVESVAGTTTIKNRVVSRGQQLVRYDLELDAQHEAVEAAWPEVCRRVKHALEQADLLLLSDYAKGVLFDPRTLIKMANDQGLPVVVDPKRKDFSAYSGATAITPNLAEFLHASSELTDVPDLDARAEAACRSWGISHLCLTRGGDGVSLYSHGLAPTHLPAKAQEVFDVTGAGDTFVATLSAAMSAQVAVAEACALANIAAGIAVSRHGTTAITRLELEAALAADTHGLPPVLQGARITEWVAAQHAQGRQVVMTNGCFDVLHPGHLECLQAARKEGGCLLVALNSDESIRRLKGQTRPINPLVDRLRMLQGCRDVDALVVFEEDTPAQVIHQVTPDVLVKGGDYAADEIVGAEYVRKNGGRVCIVPLRSGYSSTALINRMVTDD